MNLLKSPWLVLVLFAASFFLGNGFTDYESFQQWFTAHFPQLGAFGTLLPLVWLLLNRIRKSVDLDGLREALRSGEVDFERLGDVREVVTGTLSAGAADASFVALFHCCEHDAEVTDALNTAHSLYRRKRVPDTLPVPARPAA